MRSGLGLCTAALLLAACGPVRTYYKEGVPVARLDSDLTTCKVAALKDVPKDIRKRYIPPKYSPFAYCDAYGHCSVRYRPIYPGGYETYDANADLREDVTDQCMARKGYGLVELPICDGSVAASAGPPGTVLPPLSDASCAARLKSGRYRIVTP